MPVSTKFDMRDDPAVVRNYGRMLVDLATVIPDGIIAFFVSYSYMDKIVSKWDQMGVLQASVKRQNLVCKHVPLDQRMLHEQVHLT